MELTLGSSTDRVTHRSSGVIILMPKVLMAPWLLSYHINQTLAKQDAEVNKSSEEKPLLLTGLGGPLKFLGIRSSTDTL